MRERRALKLLDERRAELENCAFCPKLSRVACPVSNVEPSETLTPWGKMGSVYAVATGSVPASRSFAAPAWACTGCFACRELCEQRNSVAETLFEARAPFSAQGFDPPASARVRERFPVRQQELRARVTAARARDVGHDDAAETALLVGCEYALRLASEFDEALLAARALFGKFRLLAGCCGYPLVAAGDLQGARAAREQLRAEMAGASQLVAVDAGCAFTLRELGASPFARAAHERLQERAPRGRAASAAAVRYHDPCLLGRGLGEYDRPRELITWLYGEPPAEFSRERKDGHCSGGGGLLPATRPANARAIARERVGEHQRLGGGTIVTACARSLRQFREAGADALDLVAVVRRLAAGSR